VLAIWHGFSLAGSFRNLMHTACEYSMHFAAAALIWSSLPPDRLKGLHFGIAGREDMISAMLSEHGDLVDLLVCDGEGKPEKGV
jgi:hypothetical protein